MSQLVECVTCGARVSSSAKCCPKCGEPNFCPSKSVLEEKARQDRLWKQQDELRRKHYEATHVIVKFEAYGYPECEPVGEPKGLYRKPEEDTFWSYNTRLDGTKLTYCHGNLTDGYELALGQHVIEYYHDYDDGGDSKLYQFRVNITKASKVIILRFHHKLFNKRLAILDSVEVK